MLAPNVRDSYNWFNIKNFLLIDPWSYNLLNACVLNTILFIYWKLLNIDNT